MQRDVLLLSEMIDAAGQAQALTDGITVDDLTADRQRRDALLWNLTVLGEAAAQLSGEVKDRCPRRGSCSRCIRTSGPVGMTTGPGSAVRSRHASRRGYSCAVRAELLGLPVPQGQRFPGAVS